MDMALWYTASKIESLHQLETALKYWYPQARNITATNFHKVRLEKKVVNLKTHLNT
jgi:uncharacterized protein YccT (UPF0319 family)